MGKTKALAKEDGLMDNKNKGDMLDEFWDLSSYAPPKKTAAKEPETVSTASIEIPAKAYSQGDSKQRDTVIKRYIAVTISNIDTAVTIPIIILRPRISRRRRELPVRSWVIRALSRRA